MAKVRAKAAAVPYEATPRELEGMKAFSARRASRPAAPGLKATKQGNATKLDIDHPDARLGMSLLMEAVGTADGDFMHGLLQQLSAVAGDKTGTDGINFLLSAMQGVQPRDEVEAMLAAQMAATHKATMLLAKRLIYTETIQQQDSAERAFNKLARTFTAQVEALKRYRSAGEQTVRVEHVTVNEGGQAIVGNVTGGGESRKHAG
jgi:hypothetical protein